MEDSTVTKRTNKAIADDPSRFNTRIIIDSKFKESILKIQLQKLSDKKHDHEQNHELTPKILAYFPNGRPFSTQSDETTKNLIKEAEYYITSSIKNEKIKSLNEISVGEVLNPNNIQAGRDSGNVEKFTPEMVNKDENKKSLRFPIANGIPDDFISEKLVENMVDDNLDGLNSGFDSISDLNLETTTKSPVFVHIEKEITDDKSSEKIVENMLNYALVNSIYGFDSNSDSPPDLNLESTIISENKILEKSPDFVLNDTTATGKNLNEIVEQERNKVNISEQGYIEEKSENIKKILLQNQNKNTEILEKVGKENNFQKNEHGNSEIKSNLEINETPYAALVKEIKAKINEKSEKVKKILEDRNKKTEILEKVSKKNEFPKDKHGYSEIKSNLELNESSDETLIKGIKEKILEKSERVKKILKNRNKNKETLENEFQKNEQSNDNINFPDTNLFKIDQKCNQRNHENEKMLKVLLKAKLDAKIKKVLEEKRKKDPAAKENDTNEICEGQSNEENTISEEGYCEIKSNPTLNKNSDEALFKEIKEKIRKKSEKVKKMLKNQNENKTILEQHGKGNKFQKNEQSSYGNKELQETNILSGKSFSCDQNLQPHTLNVHEGIKKFKCDQCDKKYDRSRYLRRHISEVHVDEGIQKFKCDFENCGKAFVKSGHLKEHKTIAHYKDKNFKCDQCEKKYFKSSHLNRHILEVHNNNEIKEEKKLRAILKAKQKATIKKVSEERRRRRRKKEKVGISSRNCQIKDDLKISSVECQFCNKTLINQTTLRTHIKTIHEDGKNHTCMVCHKKFISNSAMLIHIVQVHEEQSSLSSAAYSCHKCGKSFHSNVRLEDHYDRMHRPRSKYICDICHISYAQLNILKKHQMLEHQGLVKYNCILCEKIYLNNDNLNNHIRIVHEGVKKYSCEACDKVFGFHSHLRDHRNSVHDNVRFACKMCSKSYSKNTHLNRHVAVVHKGESVRRSDQKSVNCQICEKTFQYGHVLKRHIMEVHEKIQKNKVRNHKCPTCGKTFYEKRNVQNHIDAIHLGKKDVWKRKKINEPVFVLS